MALVAQHNLKQTHNNIFGQIVIGPPGSGKTTYCHKITEFYAKFNRKVAIVNLDPANENMEYKADVDIMNLITVEEVMAKFNLGPNGSLMYCMEFLEKNFDWLLQQVSALEVNYFIFDCPGQVELYTHHSSISNIFSKFETHRFQLCAVNLIDSHYCSEPNKFIAALLLSLNTMLQIGLPHVNVFSKADLFKKYESKLLFSLDYYTEVLDLHYLVEALNQSPSMAKYAKLNAAIVSMVEDYSLVTFQPLDVNNMESLVRLKSAIDKANGYIYGASEEQSINSLLACAVGAETQTDKQAKDIDPYMS